MTRIGTIYLRLVRFTWIPSIIIAVKYTLPSIIMLNGSIELKIKNSTLHGIKSLLDHKYRTFIDKFRRATQLYYNENP